MISHRKIRFIEPQGRRGRPMNIWINRWPLLGPITLATILHNRGYDATVYNENISGPLEENPEAYADVCSADVVGISLMTPTAPRGYAVAQRIRTDAPEVKIVFGGVHATFLPDEALAHGDVVVRGEGETVIEAIASGQIDSGIVKAEPLANLDDIPPLNHFLMRDFDKLLADCRKRELYALPAMASRGCPYGCTYCCVTRMFGRKVRRQSVEKVYSDLRHYASQGFRLLFFYDDNFTSDPEWTKAVLAKARPLRMLYNIQTRADFHWKDKARRHLDKELLRSLRRDGGQCVYIGYETLDDATAKHWNKGYHGDDTLEARLREDTRILHDIGLWIHGMFVIGPHHTSKTVGKVVDFAVRNEINSLQMSILTPFPGTPLLEQMRPHLFLNQYPGDWDYYDGTHCVYTNSRMGVTEFQETMLREHKRFYHLGGWNAHSIRSIMRRPVTMWDKVVELWYNTNTAVIAMRRWRKEIDTFLKVVESRTNGALASS